MHAKLARDRNDQASQMRKSKGQNKNQDGLISQVIDGLKSVVAAIMRAIVSILAKAVIVLILGLAIYAFVCERVGNLRNMEDANVVVVGKVTKVTKRSLFQKSDRYQLSDSTGTIWIKTQDPPSVGQFILVQAQTDRQWGDVVCIETRRIGTL